MISRSSVTDHFLVSSMQTSMDRIPCTGLSEHSCSELLATKQILLVQNLFLALIVS